MPSAKEIADEIFNRTFDRQGGKTGQTNLGAIVAWYDANVTATISGTVDGVLHTPVPWAGLDGAGPTATRNSTTLALQAGWLDAQVGGLAAQNAALRSLVEQLAVKQGVVIDYEKIAKAVNDDAARRLKE